MNYTKEEVEKAVIRLAKYVGKEDEYRGFFDRNEVLPRIVELFLVEFDSVIVDDNIQNYYLTILEYAREMRNKGFAEFNS